MSNYDYETVFAGTGHEVTLGHEIVNGTGEVYIDATKCSLLSNEDAYRLAIGIIRQAEEAIRWKWHLESRYE